MPHVDKEKSAFSKIDGERFPHADKIVVEYFNDLEGILRVRCLDAELNTLIAGIDQGVFGKDVEGRSRESHAQRMVEEIWIEQERLDLSRLSADDIRWLLEASEGWIPLLGDTTTRANEDKIWLEEVSMIKGE